MKRLIAFASLLLITAASYAQTSPTNSPETASNSFFTALQNEDNGTMWKILTDDFLITTVTGQSADKALLGQILSGGQLVVETATTSDTKSRIVSPNTGLISGKLKFKGNLQGEAFDSSAVFTLVAIKQGDNWKVSDVRLIGK